MPVDCYGQKGRVLMKILMAYVTIVMAGQDK